MRRAVAYSVFSGWLLMAGYGYAQVPTAETLIWQRVPVTLSAAPATPVTVYSVPSQAGVVPPAIGWQPVSRPAMPALQLISNSQLRSPLAATATAPMMVRPASVSGASSMIQPSMIQPMGHWQAMRPAAMPWQPVLQQSSAMVQPTVYWQPVSVANQVPRLGSPATQSNGFAGNYVRCGGTSTIPIDAYSRGNTSGYGSGSVARYRPIMSLGSVPQDYQVGQGLLGQPKVYVPGQPLRNFVRYLTP